MKEVARGEGMKVALDQSEIHNNEEKCKIQAYTRVPTGLTRTLNQSIRVKLENGLVGKSAHN